jgi:hypothetical protein
MDVRIGRQVLVGKLHIAGIDDHRKVRAVAELVGSINRLVKTLVGMSAQRGVQMAANGKPSTPIRCGSMRHSATDQLNFYPVCESLEVPSNVARHYLALINSFGEVRPAESSACKRR